jgi:hypothetical protein
MGRRAFLSGAVGFTAASYLRVLGANDTLQLGVIGVGDRGRSDMDQFLAHPNVHVGALCDIYAEEFSSPSRRGANGSRYGCHSSTCTARAKAL